MTVSTVQKAHDALLALQPAGAVHENCPLCARGDGLHAEQEVAQVADAAAPVITGNQYSEQQHFSLLKSAVEQETAALSAEKSELQTRIDELESEKAAAATELSEAKSKLDVLEADKVTAEAAAETAKTELANFKAEIERAARITELKASRQTRVKAANEHLSDAYFSDERITRWAEMADEAFDALVAEMTEFAAAAKTEGDDKDDKSTDEKARETAAFSGGETARPSTKSAEGSTLSLLLAKRQGAVA